MVRVREAEDGRELSRLLADEGREESRVAELGRSTFVTPTDEFGTEPEPEPEAAAKLYELEPPPVDDNFGE